MPFTTEAKNNMLDSRLGTGASSGTYASLHTADPGTTATTALANEATGGTYARQQVNFNAAAGGQKTLAANPVFNVQAGKTITHCAYWRVSSAGAQADFVGSAALSASETFGSDGTYTLTSETFSI